LKRSQSTTYDEKKMEAGGVELSRKQILNLLKSGQLDAILGQIESHPGQQEELAKNGNAECWTETALDESHPGRCKNIKSAQLEHKISINISDSSSPEFIPAKYFSEDLIKLILAWPRLSPEMRQALQSMIEAATIDSHVDGD